MQQCGQTVRRSDMAGRCCSPTARLRRPWLVSAGAATATMATASSPPGIAPTCSPWSTTYRQRRQPWQHGSHVRSPGRPMPGTRRRQRCECHTGSSQAGRLHARACPAALCRWVGTGGWQRPGEMGGGLFLRVQLLARPLCREARLSSTICAGCRRALLCWIPTLAGRP